MRPLRAARLVLAAFLALASLAGPAAAGGFEPLPLSTSEIGRFRIGRDDVRFGEFEFRGGLLLTSPDRSFGGLSGIDFEPGGVRFLAVSDMGYWFRGEAVRHNGWLVGIAAPEWAPMLNEKGRPLGAKRFSDAEAIRLVRIDGKPAAYVTFERTNTLRLYRFGADPAMARPQAVRLPKSAKGLVRNRGLEALALAPAKGPLAGSPVLVSERSLDKAGNHRAWIVRGPLAGAFSVVRSGDFDVTDADFLPNGDLLLLERKVVFRIGVAMRLRRIAGEDLRPGTLVDGPVVMEASMAHQIDNMEGLAVSQDADGRTRITLVSDDNLSRIQRSLMLEFLWLGPIESAESR